MLKRENIAIGVSILALIVSAASFYTSCDVQRHTQTVGFEQRRQEVRQLIIQGQLLTQQANQEVRAALREEQDPRAREDLADILHKVTGFLKQHEYLVQLIKTFSATADTSARVDLEHAAGEALEVNRRGQELLEELRAFRKGRTSDDAEKVRTKKKK